MAFGAMGGGCRPKAKITDEQPRQQLEVPGFVIGDDPFLAGKDLSYQGQSLIFSSNASVESVRQMIETSSATRRAKADWLVFERDSLLPNQTKIAVFSGQVQQLEEGSRRSDATQRAGEFNAKVWFETALEDLSRTAVVQSPEEQQRARHIFEKYCEAKIWELAVSSFATAQYKERPSPLMFCEEYYTRAGFFGTPECRSSDSGKSYLKCLWQDGLMKTLSFVAHYDTPFALRPAETKRAKLLEWTEDGTLLAVISGPNGAQLLNAALSQDRLRVSSVLGRDYKDVFVPDQGTPSERPELPLEQASPFMFLAAFEEAPLPTMPSALNLAPAGELDPQAQARLAGFRRDVQVFSQRVLADPSVSDFLFWRPVVAVDEPSHLAIAKELPELAIFFASDPEVTRKILELREQKRNVEVLLEQKKLEGAALFATFTNLLREGAIAASSSGVTDSLWITSSLRLERLVREGDFRVTFQIEGNSPHIARLCLGVGGKSMESCSGDEPNSPGLYLDHALVNGRHEASTTELVLEMQLDEPETFGFELNPGDGQGSGNPFSNLDPALLRGKILRLELYPNRVREVLSYYSGKLQVFDRHLLGDQSLHEGAINLMAN